LTANGIKHRPLQLYSVKLCTAMELGVNSHAVHSTQSFFIAVRVTALQS